MHLKVRSHVNKSLYGQPNAGIDMRFDFADLIVEAARTRELGTGTIIGSGTVANAHEEILPIRGNGIGFSCIVEARTMEKIKIGAPRTLPGPATGCASRLSTKWLPVFGARTGRTLPAELPNLLACLPFAFDLRAPESIVRTMKPLNRSALLHHYSLTTRRRGFLDPKTGLDPLPA